MVPWLWVPLTQRFVALNWNLAASGIALTASSAPNSASVLTPFLVVIVVMVRLLSRWSGIPGRSLDRTAGHVVYMVSSSGTRD
jgi:hypothetical protein